MLLSLHLSVAALVDIKEIALDPTEAKQLSEAIKEVVKHYPVAFDPKKMAIANLLIVAGGIYGTRILAYRSMHPKKPGPVPVPNPIKTNGVPAPPAGRDMSLVGMNPSQLWNAPPTDNGAGF